MKNKTDPRPKWLFDPHEEELAGKAYAKLQNTWAGVFRDTILSLMPNLTNIRHGKFRASWLGKTCENCVLLNQCPAGKHKNRYVLVYSKVTLRIAVRRVAEQLPKFRDRYRRRSGIEGLFRRLDVLTSLKQLKVRGPKAVFMSVYLKIAMYNVYQAAKVWKREKMETWASNFAVHLFVPIRLQAFEARQSLWKVPCHLHAA